MVTFITFSPQDRILAQSFSKRKRIKIVEEVKRAIACDVSSSQVSVLLKMELVWLSVR